MGCDIHPIVERRDDATQPWQLVRLPWPIWDRLNDRNYVLFGVLGGVRYYDVKPIAKYRGLPESVQAYSRDGEWVDADAVHEPYPDLPNPRPVSEYDRHEWLGGHSHSYVTLRELQSFPWLDAPDPNGTLDWQGYPHDPIPDEEIAEMKQDVIERTEWFRGDFLDYLATLVGTDGDSDDVRLVFGFDS